MSVSGGGRSLFAKSKIMIRGVIALNDVKQILGL
jgi:hypothetical protein